jgi:hypothetical protein
MELKVQCQKGVVAPVLSKIYLTFMDAGRWRRGELGIYPPLDFCKMIKIEERIHKGKK